MDRKDWRKDYVMVVTWDEDFQMTRHRWVHISVEKPKEYVLNFFPGEVIME